MCHILKAEQNSLLFFRMKPINLNKRSGDRYVHMQSFDFGEPQHTNLSCSLISNPFIGSHVDLLLLLAFLIGDQLCWFSSAKANTQESQTKAAVFERWSTNLP